MLITNPPVLLARDFYLLKHWVQTEGLLFEIRKIAGQAPFRHYTVPGGKLMSVAMTCCGKLGWTSSAAGYVYSDLDPITGAAWPGMPQSFQQLATTAARAAGWPAFEPDSCLINRYEPGSGMGLHQDRDEQDFNAPIVSVSIGATCRFMVGGLKRSDPVRCVELNDGDVLVWGGLSRLVFHGVRPLSKRVKQLRYNLTFRKAAA